MQRFDNYLEKCEVRLITATRSNIDYSVTNEPEITRKNGKKNNSMDILND